MTTEDWLCESCRELKPVAYTDPLGRQYCAGCFVNMPVPTVTRMAEYLLRTIPFQIGDTVECRTAGVLYDGVGTIDDISVELEQFGTPVYPSFHVSLTEKAYDGAPDECWYMETQLRRAEKTS